MNVEAAAEVYTLGDVVTITQFAVHNGRQVDRSSGRIKSISNGIGNIPYISIGLELLSFGDKSYYLIEFPTNIKNENGVLSIKDYYHYYEITRNIGSA